MRRLSRRITGLILVLALAVGAPVVALAQTDGGPGDRQTITDDVGTVEERALEAIDRRLEQIDRLESRIEASPYIERDHEARLTGELRRAADGLAGLREEIEAAGTLDELRLLVPKIATDYRIYLVVTPKVREVIASDTGAALGERAEEIAATIQAAIDRAAALGHDVSGAQSHLDDMIEEAAAGAALADPVAEVVMPLDASDWPDPARGVLEQGAHDLKAARDRFREARESAHEAMEALRGVLGR